MRLGVHLYLPMCTFAQGQCWLKLLCMWNVRGSWQIPTYLDGYYKGLIILLYCTIACIFFFPGQQQNESKYSTSWDNNKIDLSNGIFAAALDNDFVTKHCSFLSRSWMSRAESPEVGPLTLDRVFNDLKNFAWSLWDISKVSAWRSPNAFFFSHPSSDLWHPSPVYDWKPWRENGNVKVIFHPFPPSDTIFMTIKHIAWKMLIATSFLLLL